MNILSNLCYFRRYCTFQRNEPCSLPAIVEMIAAFMKKTPDEVALATAFNALKLFGLSQWQRSHSAIRPAQRPTRHRNTTYAYGWAWHRRLGGIVIDTHTYTCAIAGCVAHCRSVVVFVPSQQFVRPGVHCFLRVVNVKVSIMPLLLYWPRCSCWGQYSI